MIVLGFDTSTPASAIGLRLHDGATVQTRDDPAQGERPGHATRLLPLAADLLSQAGLRFTDVERIAVGVGPGTFTGLRIGVASARGLAQSLDVDLVGVSSPRALALAAVGSGEVQGEEGVLALIDARRSEVFAAAYASVADPLADRAPRPPRELAPPPRELVSPLALAPAGFGEMLARAALSEQGVSGQDVNGQGVNGQGVNKWVAVGNGAALYREDLSSLGVRVPAEDSPLHRVSAEAICALAVSGGARALETVLPDYRRRPDAELALEGAAAAPGAGT